MITRRTFMFSAVASAAVFKLGCEPCTGGSADCRLNLPGYIPCRLFACGTVEAPAVTLAAIQHAGEKVNCILSDGTRLQFDATSSYRDVQREQPEPKLVTLQLIVLSSLVSWGLDAIRASIRNRRDPERAAEIEAAFAEFQTSAVLQTATPLSLYRLARDSAQPESIRSVVWNPADTTFEVD